MASPAYSTPNRLLPFLAILETDLKMMTGSWLVRIWAVLLAGQSLLWIATGLDETTIASDAIAGMLGFFPVLWSTVVIVFSGGAVSSESGVVADSILSKAVRRTEYILGKLLARLTVVLGLFLLFCIPVTVIIARNAAGTVDTVGLLWAFALVGAMLTLLTCLTVASSTLFNRTLVAVVVIWFAWYIAGTLTGLLQIDYLSPLSIVDQLPVLIAGDYQTGEMLRSMLTYLLLSSGAMVITLLYFSRKDV